MHDGKRPYLRGFCGKVRISYSPQTQIQFCPAFGWAFFISRPRAGLDSHRPAPALIKTRVGLVLYTLKNKIIPL